MLVQVVEDKLYVFSTKSVFNNRCKKKKSELNLHVNRVIIINKRTTTECNHTEKDCTLWKQKLAFDERDIGQNRSCLSQCCKQHAYYFAKIFYILHNLID